MGVESSALSGCTLEEPLPESASAQPQDWTIHPGKRADGSRVSVFIHKHDHDDQDLKRTKLYQHAAKQLKVLRHPTILKFFASCNNVDSTYLMTEQVKPLELVIDMLSPEEICAGMHNLVEALSFLHDRGEVSHNNVCMSSIYVSSSDGGWRLGGMEHLCKFEDATLEFLNQSRPLRNAQAIPPEEKEEGVKTSIGPSIGHARDAYGFGILALTLLEYLGDLGSISSTFSAKIEEQFLNPEPKKRPKMKTLLPNEIFRNDFLDIMSFLHKLVLKSEIEKTVFFEGLAAHLYRLPAQLVASRLIQPLLTSFVMVEPIAVSMLFPHLLTPRRESKKNPEFLSDRINPILPLDMFQRHMIPLLTQVFPSREMHIRSLLLQYFSGFVDLFDENTLKQSILPQLLLGLKDQHAHLVAESLRALADLVPLIGPELVIGGKRLKYFVEGRPKFPSKSDKIRHEELTKVPHLTAVSGVITLPSADPSPMFPPGVGDAEGMRSRHEMVELDVEMVPASEESSETGVAVGEDAVVGAARRAEREKRREEMRMRNEQRRREREEKRKLLMTKEAPVSPTSEKLGNRLPPEGSIDNSSFSAGENASSTNISLSEHSENAAIDHSEKSDTEQNERDSLNHEGSETGGDWSDWEDADKKQPIESADAESMDQIQTMKRDSAKSVDLERPSESAVTKSMVLPRTGSRLPDEKESRGDEWGGDWNEGNSDWSAAKAKSSIGVGSKKSLKLKVKDNQDGDKKKATPGPQKPSVRQEPKKLQGMSTQVLRKGRSSQDFDELYGMPEIKIKTKPSPEDDLFAEMEPTLSFSSTKQKGNDDAKPASPKEKVAGASLSLAMADTAEDEDTAGWGDDDWNFDVDS